MHAQPPPVAAPEHPGPSAATSALELRPWEDAQLDRAGHDPRGWYVEHCWLPILGPSATWLLRRLVERLEEHPGGLEVDLTATARSLGLGAPGGRHSPILRSLGRLERYAMARREGDTALLVRRRVGLVPRRYLLRLPSAEQERHRRLVEWGEGDPGPYESLRRARLLALDLLGLGLEPSSVEVHLHRRGVHPALAADASRWARSCTATGHPPGGGDDRSADAVTGQEVEQGAHAEGRSALREVARGLG